MHFNIFGLLPDFLGLGMASSSGNEVKHVAEKLRNLAPVFSNICSISAATGLSLGVLHHGEVIHTAHFGRRDVDNPTPPNDDTIYHVASLTKAITASAAAILVEEKKLSWCTRIREVLPGFTREDEIGRSATIADVLSHRTGMVGANALWIQRNQNFYMPKNETVATANYLKAVKPFRKSFLYNNWGYGLVTEIIEKISGKTYGAYVKDAIFEPLGMKRTSIDLPAASDDNVACAHVVKDDGTSVKIPHPPQSDKTGLAGAGAAKSSVSDLLRMYKALMGAYKHQLSSNTTTTPGLPFAQMKTVFEGHTTIGSANIEDEAYTLGWVKAKLPMRLGRIGMNELYLGDFDRLPVIGEKAPGTIVYHHQGNLVGMLSSVHIVPETETAIIVMCNSLSFTDAADFIGELILEITLEVPKPQDYIALSKQARDGFHAMYPTLIKELQEGKTEVHPTKPFGAYIGRYFNKVRNFVLEVSEHDGGLRMVSQGFSDAAYQLQPYDGDTFYWSANREDEMCTHSMFPWVWPGVHQVTFSQNNAGDIDRLSWAHDWDQGPETFMKLTTVHSDDRGPEELLRYPSPL